MRPTTLFSCCLLVVALTKLGAAQERGIINNGRSPHCKLRSIDLSDVHWMDGFWKQKFDLVRHVTIPKMWEYYNGIESKNEPGNSHWKNFRIAAGLEDGKWSGTNWHDGDLYKWIEAVAHVYMATHDNALDQQMDEVIEVIGKVQEPDGYIWTRGSLEKRERFQHIHDHELYNMGHLMTAACIHHRATGKTSFLDIARKTGDCLYETFKDGKPELAQFGFNPSNIMGLVELYRTTGERRYLDLANRFIDMRGSRPGPFRSTELGGTDQTQDRVPLRKAKEAVGHAVCGTYLYCGAADAFMETGDKTLLEALDRLWLDVTRRKMYIHGGVGPFTHGLSLRRDHVGEAFGHPYFLPNRKCYCETCSNIGNAMWNWRMLSITGDARFADVMEQVFYNSGISGIGINGIDYFYTNIHRFYGQDHQLLSNDALKRWNLPRGGICCPPNVVRLNTEMSAYAYGISRDAVWVNLYGSNRIRTDLPGGNSFAMNQVSDYPWEGDIRFTLEDVPDQAMGILLRIPGWAAEASITVNGKAVEQECKPGTYVELRREWAPGDKIYLKFPMDIRIMEGHPRIEQVLNQVAIMRGPVVYCLESVDLPGDIDVGDIVIPGNINFKIRYETGVLDGVAVLIGEALAHRRDVEWQDQLYRIMKRTNLEPVAIQLIPYYAWNNRHSSSRIAGVPQMTVWMPFRY